MLGISIYFKYLKLNLGRKQHLSLHVINNAVITLIDGLEFYSVRTILTSKIKLRQLVSFEHQFCPVTLAYSERPSNSNTVMHYGGVTEEE